jgi:signal transduction histidine kinase
MTSIPIFIPKSIDIEEFISEEAHDLRSPFNHVIGFSKMILNTIKDHPFTDIQKEDLGTVYRSGLRSLTLINGLIDIARINRHEKGIDRRDVNIQNLWATSLANWKKFNPDATFQPEFTSDARSATIFADEALLRQVISGFISFTAYHCDTDIRVSITLEEKAEYFLFTFSSNGRKAAHLPVLDLKLIGFVNYSIITLHQGEISSAMEEDDGAEVRFIIPKSV